MKPHCVGVGSPVTISVGFGEGDMAAVVVGSGGWVGKGMAKGMASASLFSVVRKGV